MSHEEIRLETVQGDVIMYFAPSMEWETSHTNDIESNPLPGADQEAVSLDQSMWSTEITVQGQFQHSHNLPMEHRQALLELEDWTEPITAQQQADRVAQFVRYDPSPPYHLYVLDREYRAATPNNVEPIQGVFPHVAVTEIRTPDEAGRNDEQWLFRFVSGRVEDAG